MENDFELVLDLVIAMSVALVGGWIAVRIGLSAIAGYVAAGIVISPFTPGFVGDIDDLRLLADIGVVLIMFGIGVQFSLREIAGVGVRVLAAAAAQVALVMAAGTTIGIAAGWGRDASLFTGAAIAISSSTVIVKLLGERGETTAAHGRIAIAWAVVQDIAAILIVGALIAVTDEGDAASGVGLTILKIVGFVGGMFLIGLRAVPWALNRIADLGSREMFVLAIAALALGTAFFSERVGLSLALGAFIAGIVVSESDLSHRVLGELLPARDVFAVIFFVSVGMLIDPDVLRDQPVELAVLLLLIVAAKGLLTAGLTWLTGQRWRVASPTGGLMANAGEFSFVLVGVGLDEAVVSNEIFSLVVAAAAISIVVSPVVLRLSFVRSPEHDLAAPEGESPQRSRLGRHAVVCGHGEVGGMVVSVLRQRFEVVVVEQDPRAVRSLADSDVRVIIGDASSPNVIEQMQLEECRVLVIAIADPFATRLLVERARAFQPDIDIIARALTAGEAEKLRSSGAGFAIEANREVALEMVRHSLHRFGIDQRQALAIVQRMRTQ